MRELPPAVLDHLADVDTSGVQDGWTIVWDEVDEVWRVGPGAGGAALLTDDNDPLVFLTDEDETFYLTEG